MCNPPFYSSAEDVQKSAESKEFDPHAVRLVLHIKPFMILMNIIIGMYWCGRGDDNRRGRGRFCWTNLAREHTDWETLQVRHYLKTTSSTYWLKVVHVTSWQIVVNRQHRHGTACISRTSLNFLGASVAESFHRLTIMGLLNLYKAILDAGPSFGRLERIDYPMYVCLPPTRSILSRSQTLVRVTSSTIHPYLPLPNNLRQLYPSARDSTQLLGLLAQACSELESVSCRAATSQSGLEVVEISAKCNTWSRAARRRQKATGAVDTPVTIDNSVAMACFVHCARTGAGEFYLEASWAKGKDRSLFETFWSHTSRKIGTGLEVAAV
jgi:hypothetical protein